MIKQTEAGGVPVLLAPTNGPTQAGLAFRVGFADEPLSRRGITHLIEHLALHAMGVTDYHYNGATGVETTSFVMQGRESDIVTFVNGVCSSLLEPPMRRLPVEKEILRTEASTRRRQATERMAMWRHGARDYGMSSYPEWGLTGIAESDLREWVARYFVRQNAVLWVAGSKKPEGLRLTLPDGAAQPAPRPSSALPTRPAFFSGSAAGVVWDSAVRNEAAVGVFAAVLERALFRALRQEGGLSYVVETDVEPRADGSSLITAVADALPDKAGAVLGGVVDVLAAMRLGLIDPAEVGTVIDQRCDGLAQAEEVGARLPGQALNLLAGRPVESLEEAVARSRAVTHGDVVRVAADAYANGLLQTPAEMTADWAGYSAAPTSSPSAVPGRPYPSIEDPRLRLVIGSEGVSLVHGDDDFATVRFEDCAGVLAWPDGARELIGADAIGVRIEPTLFYGAGAAVPWLDTRIPRHLRAEMPARDPSEIPRPRTATSPFPAPPGIGSAPAGKPGRTGPIVTLVALAPVALIAILCSLGALLTMNDPDGDRTGSIILAVLGAIVLAGAGWACAWAIRRLRG